MEITSNAKFSYASTPHAMTSKAGAGGAGAGGKPKYKEQDISRSMASNPNVKSAPKFSKSADYSVPSHRNSAAALKSNYRNMRAVNQKPVPIVYELEELTHRPIDNQDNDVDMDHSSMYNEANMPKFVKAVETTDVQTQIERNDPHLFDFDVEVRPILEVLVGKTIHISVIELKEEAEMEEIQRKEEEFEISRCVELAELQRLEADIKRKDLEKFRRRDQEAHRLLELEEKTRQLKVQAVHNEEERQLAILDSNSTVKEKMALRSLQYQINKDFLEKVLGNVRGGADSYEAASIMAEELLTRSLSLAVEFETEALRIRNISNAKARLAEEKRKRLELDPSEQAIELIRRTARDPTLRPGSSFGGAVIDLQDLFKEFDTDGNGMLGLSEIKDVLVNAGLRKITDQQLKAVFQFFDMDGDGLLNMKEFMYGMMVENPLEVTFRAVREVQITYENGGVSDEDEAAQERGTVPKEEGLSVSVEMFSGNADDGGLLSPSRFTIGSAKKADEGDSTQTAEWKKKKFDLNTKIALHDRDGKGVLTKREINWAFQEMGVSLDEDSLNAFINNFDPAGRGLTNYGDLTTAYNAWLRDKEPIPTAEATIGMIRRALSEGGPTIDTDFDTDGDDERSLTSPTAASLVSPMAGDSENPMSPGLEDFGGDEGFNLNAGARKPTKYDKLSRAFAKADKDSTGSLDFDSFKPVLQSLGIMMPEETIKDVFAHFDLDGSGTIDYGEFVQGVVKDSVLEEAFRMIQKGEAKNKNIIDFKELLHEMAKTQKGMLTRDELEAGLRKKKCKLPSECLDQLFETFDSTMTGTIAADEFAGVYSTWRSAQLPRSAAEQAMISIRTCVENESRKVGRSTSFVSSDGSYTDDSLHVSMLTHLYKLCKRRGFAQSDNSADPDLASSQIMIKETLEGFGLTGVQVEDVEALVRHFDFQNPSRIDTDHTVCSSSTDVPLATVEEFIETVLFASRIEDAFRALQRTEARYKQPVELGDIIKCAEEEGGGVTKESLSRALMAKKVVLTEPEVDALLHKFTVSDSLPDLVDVYSNWREANLPLTTKEKALAAIRDSLNATDADAGLGDTEPPSSDKKSGTTEKKDLHALFTKFDTDSSGSLSADEIKKALSTLGVRLSDDAFQSLYHEFDADGSGSVKYTEFVHGVMIESQIDEVFRQIQKAAAVHKNKLDLSKPFKDFDKSGDGSLNKKEFKLALFNMKVRVKEETMDAIFKHFDPDGSGGVKYAEFAAQFFNRKKLVMLAGVHTAS